jgi:hypothetical protein
MSPGTKFAWIFALGADPGIGYAERYILTMTALKSAHPKDLTFTVRQATIAENCSASERTVRRALAAGRRHGYIELVTERKRGRGNHGADEYRLCLPANEIPAPVAAIPHGKYRPPAPKIAATGAENTGQTRSSDQRELHPPLGLLEVSRRSAATAAPPPMSPEDEPDRYCQAHMPDGTDAHCRPCGQARQRHQRWQADQVERDRVTAEARRTIRLGCTLCAGGFWVVGPDGTPVEPAQACPVCKPRSAAG